MGSELLVWVTALDSPLAAYYDRFSSNHIHHNTVQPDVALCDVQAQLVAMQWHVNRYRITTKD